MSAQARVCVYTGIFGAFDELAEQPAQTVPCDFVCFTDAPGIGPVEHGWRIERIRDPRIEGLHPRTQAKFPKLMPHELSGLREYDYTIWVDGNVRIRRTTFAEEMIGYLGENGMAIFVHPERDCIYDEAEECQDYPKYQSVPVREQVAAYRAEGMPEGWGLSSNGVIARDMRNPRVWEVGEAWWAETLAWTYQDQLSLPYVLWKRGLGYDKIDLYIWKNHLFELADHRSEL